MKFGQRVTGLLVGGAIAVGLVFYIFGKVDGYLAHHDRVVSDSSQAMVKIHAAHVRWRTKLAAAERRQVVLAAAAHDTANQLRAALASGARVDTVPVLIAIAKHDSTALKGCSLVVLTCQQRALHAEAEAERLTHQLERQLTVRDHRCGLWVGGGIGTAGKGEAQIGIGCRLLRLPFLP